MSFLFALYVFLALLSPLPCMCFCLCYSSARQALYVFPSCVPPTSLLTCCHMALPPAPPAAARWCGQWSACVARRWWCSRGSGTAVSPVVPVLPSAKRVGVLWSPLASDILAKFSQFHDFLSLLSLAWAALSPPAAATAEELERMGGQCAICWGDMPVPGGGGGGGEGAPAAPPAEPAAAEGGAGPGSGPDGRGMALPCSHAFHRGCLQQWLHQCYG